jgi:O-6-methylguanine DNA methyltransferase
MHNNPKYSDLLGLRLEEKIPNAPWASSLKLVPAAPPPPQLFYGSGSSPIGPITLVWDPKEALRFLGFDNGQQTLQNSFLQYPLVKFSKKTATAQEKIAEILSLWLGDSKPASPLTLAAKGTDFQQSVWRVLLGIPKGSVVSYKNVALALGNPKAVRAVGGAVGANPLPLLIPCHRVIQSNGSLANFGWGDEIKINLLKHECRSPL